MEFGKPSWKTFERGIEKEWLITNGLGGFASSTIIGANTRRYHGLLVAALNPPVKRHLILSKIDENITVNNESYNLYSFKTNDYTMKGYLHLQRFESDTVPKFVYSIGDTIIEKQVSMVYGENTVVILYRVINGKEKSKLKLTPLVNFRDYHHTSHRAYLNFNRKLYEHGLILTPCCYDIDINIYCSCGSFIAQDDCYFLNMYYPVERERGLQSNEDHYIPGYFEVDIMPDEEKYITVIATIEKHLKITDGQALIKAEEERLERLLDVAGYDDYLSQRLVLAADQFIVYRKSTNTKTVIAGYPWFTDWGRDTMIALPGLTLATKRFEDAKEILYTFSRYVKDGLVPNMFPDEGQEPVYNSVDASLWYFEAVNKYLDYTNDYTFIRENIYPALKLIINAYMKGTDYNIKMDRDYLVSAGEKGSQLTWMDAKIGDWVVTPRHGKPVEINALWYNALMVMSRLSDAYNYDSAIYSNIAENVKREFIKQFWNQDKQFLYDVITEDYKDDRLRPNQIMAISLSYPIIEGDRAIKVVDSVWKKLYTAYGMRSLSPDSAQYIGVYEGDNYRRDSAYHQGTVWGWLLGHFITAFIRANGNTAKSREIAYLFIKSAEDHLADECIGSFSEIFDGDEPILPRGCFAQAWSVAEILRAYTEDIKV